MSDSSYFIRNYRPQDFNDYVQLNVEAEKLDRPSRCTSAQTLRDRLDRPNYLPEQDLFIAATNEKIIGYIDITPELGIGRVVLDCFVHPEHRRKGVATELFHRTLRRSMEFGARVAHVNIVHNNIAAKNLLSKLSFRLVRRFLELELELSTAQLPGAEHATLACRHLQRGEEAKLAKIQNRSFVGTWGYNPNTIEEIVHRLNRSGCSPEDVILTCEADNIDNPVGYCWTMVESKQSTAPSPNKGRIYMLGTDPDHRGRGIGKRVLCVGLSHLKSKGIEVAELTVDSENTVACALYESIGFKISSDSLWYEKAMD